jgi:hypothetical protein
MAKDHRLSVRMIAEETGLDKNAVHRILTDHLHTRKMCAKLVPKHLFEPNVLDKAITGDELWVFEYDPETKRQSVEWHTKSSPHPKTAHMSRSQGENDDYHFFNSLGIVHKEFLPPGQTITPSTKMSWNNFENGPSKSERTLQAVGCCTTIMCQLTQCFQLENFW